MKLTQQRQLEQEQTIEASIPRIAVIDAAVGKLQGHLEVVMDALIKRNDSQAETLKFIDSHRRLLDHLVEDVMKLMEISKGVGNGS